VPDIDAHTLNDVEVFDVDAPAAEEERVAEEKVEDATRAAEDEYTDEEALSENQSAKSVRSDAQNGENSRPISAASCE